MSNRREDGVTLRRKNRRFLFGIAGIALGMVGVSFAAVPLYDLFCRVTGYGGTTQQASDTPDQVLDREIVVRFDASISNDLDWRFIPAQKEVRLKVGESAIAFYRAQNNASRKTAGTAAFNVTPQKAGLYFSKIDCFCFTEQTLEPGQTVDMPVNFFVDPEIATDPNLDDVKTITLSYTFFPIEVDEDVVGESKVSGEDILAQN